jgi:hypothetical protein
MKETQINNRKLTTLILIYEAIGKRELERPRSKWYYWVHNLSPSC